MNSRFDIQEFHILMGTSKNGIALRELYNCHASLRQLYRILMPDEGIFCGSEERKLKHTLLYDKAFVTKLLREKDRVWCKIGVFRGALMLILRYSLKIQSSLRSD